MALDSRILKIPPNKPQRRRVVTNSASALSGSLSKKRRHTALGSDGVGALKDIKNTVESGIVPEKVLNQSATDSIWVDQKTTMCRPKATIRRRRTSKGQDECKETFSNEEIVHKNDFKRIRIGPFELPTEYFSPYPTAFCSGIDTIYICDKCFKYSRSKRSSERHASKCCVKGTLLPHTGKVAYDDPERLYKVYEVDGSENREFCQNLCLFCKLYLDHKTLAYDVDSFHFYVFSVDGTTVGYFSKEKHNVARNLSCIFTFPQYQGNGYGLFLISLSYTLSRAEGKICGPEKPLSPQGLSAYRLYWRSALVDHLLALTSQSIDASHPDVPRIRRTLSRQSVDSADYSDDENWTEDSEGNDAYACKTRKSARLRKDIKETGCEMSCHREGGQVLHFVVLQQLSKQLGIEVSDIVETLQHYWMFVKYKGTTIIYLNKDLVSKCNQLKTNFKECDPRYVKIRV